MELPPPEMAQYIHERFHNRTPVIGCPYCKARNALR